MTRSAPVRPRALILGCAGPWLGEEERAVLRAADPLGFILFRRNCREPRQLAALVQALRAAIGRPDAPILIDQEGGRVARLGPPHWPETPPAANFGTSAREAGIDGAAAAARETAGETAARLAALGITVNCAPVLDLAWPRATRAIGDRAFSGDPATVTALGGAVAEGLLAGGVLPVVKHTPGHGRAYRDSHHVLPRVRAPFRALLATDFAPFRALAHLPLAMTAHVVYTAIDAARPATLSRRVIEEIIRGEIGFAGLLLSDDISMGALKGPIGERAAEALSAGCDIVLHCNGRLEEVRSLSERVAGMHEAAWARWRRALSFPALSPPAPLSPRHATTLG